MDTLAEPVALRFLHLLGEGKLVDLLSHAIKLMMVLVVHFYGLVICSALVVSNQTVVVDEPPLYVLYLTDQQLSAVFIFLIVVLYHGIFKVSYVDKCGLTLFFIFYIIK